MARTQIKSDPFTATAGTTLASHTAGGCTWAQIRDVIYGSTARISSSGAKLTGYFSDVGAGGGTDQNHAAVYRETSGTYSDDQYATAVISGLGPNFGDVYRGGVVVRCSADVDVTTFGNSADFYALYVCDNDVGSGSTTILCKVVNGAFTALDNTRRAWANDDTVELEVVGTTLNCYKNGNSTPFFSTTDSSLSTGKPGIYLASHDSNATLLDDWAGGNASSGSTSQAPRSMNLYRQRRA